MLVFLTAGLTATQYGSARSGCTPTIRSPCTSVALGKLTQFEKTIIEQSGHSGNKNMVMPF